MDNSCFVTGGTGFVGLNFVEEVLKGNKFSMLYCLVRKESRRLKFLRRVIEKNESKTKTEILFGDVTNKESLERAFPRDVDAVYHIAANIVLATHSVEMQNNVNIGGTKNMIDIVLEKSPKARFIYISSISVYGKGKVGSDEIIEINETTKKEGMNEGNMNYGKSKYLGEVEVHKAIKENGLDGFILQPCSMMGEYDFLMSSWNKICEKIKNDDLTGLPGGHLCLADVKSFVEVMCNSYELGKTGEEYLVGGVNVSFKQIGDIVTKYYKKKKMSVFPYTLFWTIALFTEIGYGLRNLVCVCLKEKKYPLMNRALVNSLYSKYKVDTTKSINELGLVVTELEELVVRSCQFLDSWDEERLMMKKE